MKKKNSTDQFIRNKAIVWSLSIALVSLFIWMTIDIINGNTLPISQAILLLIAFTHQIVTFILKRKMVPIKKRKNILYNFFSFVYSLFFNIYL